ncbi:hypothetical protein SAMN05216276_1001150 [Streptosporangium subroseum]|uniref:Uncharacterized protein n=1 Tax=Streptosporangium subroseum TaxID=106412 RepID=A0A239A6D9_9ACTN|nr:hypothetical protein SAMN05216276_1001150 [Streptosporangium subroseum]
MIIENDLQDAASIDAHSSVGGTPPSSTPIRVGSTSATGRTKWARPAHHRSIAAQNSARETLPSRLTSACRTSDSQRVL